MTRKRFKPSSEANRAERNSDSEEKENLESENLKCEMGDDFAMTHDKDDNKKENNMQGQFIKSLSAEELQKYREIQFLQHSNLFRLQIEEMLSTLEIKQKTKVRINMWLSNFSEFLMSIPKSRCFQLNDDKLKSNKNLASPLKYFFDFNMLKGNFQFFVPEKIMPIGSFSSNTASTHSCEVDIALILPECFFQKSTLANCVWFHKRALYLSWIGKYLSGNKDLVDSLQWKMHLGSYLRPVLQIKPVGKLRSKWIFNIFPIPPEGYFSVSLMSPLKSNVTSPWYFNEENPNTFMPTPNYNWLCSIDVCLYNHQSYIQQNLTHSNWIQAVKILKIWLKQRLLSNGEGSISSHVITLLVLHLAKLHKISPQMSPYQIFRTTLLFISQSKWDSEGLSMHQEKSNCHRNFPSLVNFHAAYPVVFVCPTGLINLMGNVTKETYKLFVFEAGKALEMLSLSSSSCFDSLFIKKLDFKLQFDQFFKIEFQKSDIQRIFKKEVFDHSRAAVSKDLLGDFRRPVYSLLLSTVSRALGDRVDLIGVDMRNTHSWPYGTQPPDFDYGVTIGLLLNPEKSIGLLTKGPSAESAEASEFREFWGDAVSLRRFRDSTFHECVMWLTEGSGDGRSLPVAERRSVVGRVLRYAIRKHFGIAEDAVVATAGPMDNVLRIPYKYEEGPHIEYGTGEESITSAIVSFDNLSKKLRSFNLPLGISTVQSPSEIFRHSAVFPPVPSKMPTRFLNRRIKSTKAQSAVKFSDDKSLNPHYTETINVQVFLEISGKWPEDLVAVKAVKCEFLIEMADQFKKEGVSTAIFPDCLIISWEGYLFRLVVCYRREILLLRSIAETHKDRSSNMAAAVHSESAARLEMDIEILPKLTSALNGLQSDFSCFNGSARLIRRWVSAQMLNWHLPPVVVDLLTAHLFLSPQPYSAPNSPDAALLRFWRLVSQTDWRNTPILINLKDQFEAYDEAELTNRFTSSRSTFPPLFVCSPCELHPISGPHSDASEGDLAKRYEFASVWSRRNPSLPVLARLKSVAEASLNAYSDITWQKSSSIQVLFKPPLDIYDVLIHLQRVHLPRSFQHVDQGDSEVVLKSYVRGGAEMIPVFDFDPAQLYLKELRDSFDAHCLFFHDEFGGNVIGVLWKPHVFQDVEAKMSCLEGHKIFGIKEVKQMVNVDAIVEQFSVLGRGLVKRVMVKSR